MDTRPVPSPQSLLLLQQFSQSFDTAAGDPVRRKIILHAIEVFSRKGYAAAKIKDIAASAEFSQGYVYRYYSSKEELFVHIAALAADGAGNSVAWAARMEGSPLERITWLTEAYLNPDSLALQHWRFNLLVAVAPDGIPEQALTLLHQRRSEPFRHLVPLIAEGQRLGEFVQTDPLQLALTYFAMLQGLNLVRLQAGDGDAAPPPPETRLVLRFMTTNEGRPTDERIQK
ncbi:hypothetical protein PA598K_05178 [Paenibacillus sp. 598K]|uniref:TetR/AcrR family transcriptional regulator n=1 Tax=Paenibacillus sp. 598K TaxID=1117987 RepID=UPI000FFAC793|nr:TetR/AcrR family transcriptional regulator [Paenibacillus sp. 598K]GBF76693.1 hypothetical protein PA598K_05178 [Paenibacillus sp. 598K]